MSMVAGSLVSVSRMVDVLAGAEAHHNELPMPAVMFGVVAAVVFAILGFVMFSYRDVANRNRDRTSAGSAEHPGGSDSHGHDATATGH